MSHLVESSSGVRPPDYEHNQLATTTFFPQRCAQAFGSSGLSHARLPSLDHDLPGDGIVGSTDPRGVPSYAEHRTLHGLHGRSLDLRQLDRELLVSVLVQRAGGALRELLSSIAEPAFPGEPERAPAFGGVALIFQRPRVVAAQSSQIRNSSAESPGKRA